MNLRPPLLLIALSQAVLVACSGGGGALSQSLETQDRAPITNEGVSSSTEGYRSTLDRTANSQEEPARSGESSPTGGGFSCGGTYRCSLNGETDDDPVVLSPSGGGCTALDGTSLESGGITPNGNGGFTYSTTITSKSGRTTAILLVCTKISSDTTAPKKGDADKPPTAGSSTSGSSGTTTRDAG